MRIDFASLSCWNCKNAHIDRQLYEKYDVKRGLRDATGRGVLTSLTRISEVKGCTVDGQDTIPCPGVLYYRGYDVRDLEARALDAALILHADHGSNNSTFTNHVVSSTGTDTYSAMAASLCALKGPRHGGANIKVVEMMADLKSHVDDPTDEGQVREYLQAVLDKKALDGLGLIYGMGHAVYSLSDPRAEVLRGFVRDISKEKGLNREMDMYLTVEKVAKELLTARTGKPVAVNVDFYSGFLYDMLGLPKELYTPLFAIARMAGWSAHRMEELGENSKIIRPACKCIEKRRPYVPMSER